MSERGLSLGRAWVVAPPAVLGVGRDQRRGAAVEAGASAGRSSRQLLDAHVKRPSLGSQGVRAGVHPGPGSPEEAPQSETAQVVQGSGFSPPSLESSLQVCGISARPGMERADKAACTSLSAAQRCPSRDLQGKEWTMGERASRCLPPPGQ